MNMDFPMGNSGDIFQDKEGFLWIGTLHGLIRFDGYETVLFSHDPLDPTSISANNVDAIGQDSFGRMWVGLNDYGLDILDQEHKKFTQVCIPDSLGECFPLITVPDVVADGTTYMWVGSDRGLFKFQTSPDLQLVRRFRHSADDPRSLSDNFVLRTFMDRKGRLWVGTARGINLLLPDEDGFINAQSNRSFPDVQILDIAEDREGTIWLSPRYIDESLLTYNEATGNFDPVPEFQNRKLGEFRITFDLDNDLWISARSVGVYHVEAETGKRTFFGPLSGTMEGFRNLSSIQPITDRYGNVWMTGTQLIKWPSNGKAIRNLHTGGSSVISVYANEESIWYSESELWKFTRDDQINSSVFPEHLPTNIRLTSPTTIPIRRVYCIRDYDDEHVIMTSTRNIFIWNKRSKEYKEFPLHFGGPFREFVLSPDKSQMVICGNQGTPILYDLRNYSISNPEYLSDVVNPKCIAQDVKNGLWIGSSTDGVFHIEKSTGEIHNYLPSGGLSDFNVNDIAIGDKYVWVATNQGLDRIDPENRKIGHPALDIPLRRESVLSILIDDDGVLWAGTQSGIVRYDAVHEKFRRFDSSDGLINSVYTQGAAYKDAAGNLYFGGDQGVDYFDPERININPFPPDLYVSQILVNNERVDTTVAAHHINKLQLHHTENFLEIELLALHLTSPGSNKYAYRIPELDTSWRQLGSNRTITLANLQPGAYTIEAKASNADDVWSEEKKLLSIKIRPPFWITPWFIIVCAVSLAGALSAGFRYHVGQVSKRERLKSTFEKRVAELESKALRAQMNPHFLFNSINSVKSLISQGFNEKATLYLTRFGQLIRQILSNSEKPLVRLQEELEALRLYLEIEQLRFQNFSFDIQVDDNVDTDFIEVPPLILQPYVENAIWHGLMNLTSGSRKLSVHVRREASILCIAIEDNGIGREEAEKIRMLGKSRKGGMGMRVTGDRINLLKDLYGHDVSITVHDLTAHGKPAGTRVEIRIPYTD